MKLEIQKDSDIDVENSVLVCAKGRAPAGREAAHGKCYICGSEIHFSLLSPAQLEKVCSDCGLADLGWGTEMAITETTISEVIELMGLSDTPEVRTVIKRQAEIAIAKQLSKGMKDGHQTTTQN